MPLPGALAKFNRLVSNKAMRPLARRMPGFGVLRHTGRVTGKTYQTPLNVWERDNRLVVALTYGADVDWLANARASDSSMIVQDKDISVGRPTVVDAQVGMTAMPAGVRPILWLLSVEEFAAFPIQER